MAIERELKLRLTAEEAGRLERLLGSPVRVALQRNHYLDTPGGALRAVGCSLRLRREDLGGGRVRHLLTLKGPAEAPANGPAQGPAQVRGALSVREEQEVETDGQTAVALVSGRMTLPALESVGLGLQPLLALRPAQCLVHLGTTDNERRTFRLGTEHGFASPLELEVDRTSYPDGSVDWELEVELGDHGPVAAAPVAMLAPTPAAAHDPAVTLPPSIEQPLRALLARAGVAWVAQEKSKFARFLERAGR